MRAIEVVPYNPQWPELFSCESDLIREVLGENCIEIHHVGSTSVPGLAAKPKIDIIAVVHKPEKSIKQLEQAGYEFRGEYNIPMRNFFRKNDVNLHVYEKGHPEIELNLKFRDYLRSHPEVRDEYAALKHHLLTKKTSFTKNNSIFTGYNLGKNSFIQRVLNLAGFHRLRFVICTHHDEWSAAKHFRQKYFFDKVPIKDPYEWTFDHKDHIHLILYLGCKMIGYAHIQLWPASRAAIRIIVIKESERNRGYGKQFLSWIETWLCRKGYRSIHTESSPDALDFYKRQGYMDMPFNDPDGHETDSRDTPLGKTLNS